VLGSIEQESARAQGMGVTVRRSVLVVVLSDWWTADGDGSRGGNGGEVQRSRGAEVAESNEVARASVTTDQPRPETESHPGRG